MSEKERSVIIDTVKVRRGDIDVFIPKLIKNDTPVDVYDKRGRIKRAGPPKGKIVDTRG